MPKINGINCSLAALAGAVAVMRKFDVEVPDNIRRHGELLLEYEKRELECRANRLERLEITLKGRKMAKDNMVA